MKHYLQLWIAAGITISSFVMCTKSINKIDKAVTATPTNSEKVTDAPVVNTVVTPQCTYTVQPAEWMIDGSKFAAGSVICIPAGTRGAILFKNLKGTVAQPIIIMNKGGRVTITATLSSGYAFKTQNCQNFKVLGNGAPGVTYGIDINGGNISMTLDDLSSDFEIANVEVRNSGFAGIMAKTDPSCDINTQRGHFTMRNVSLHDNYVHATGGEGFYVGNSFYASGMSASCGTVLPHDVVNVKVYKNITDSTGCEGIQVGSATSGAQIYSNTVRSPGRSPFAAGQNNGIQIGEGTGGKCYNNLVKNAPGNGIIVLGLGDNQVYNNYILNAGGHGIFADSRYTPGPYFQFINNTIISPALNGIKLNSETIQMNFAINNAIISPGLGVAIQKKSNAVKLTASNNFNGNDVGALKFVSYSTDNFHLQSSSPLINAGASVLLYGIVTDYYGKLRPSGLSYDIGATEY